jgi:hypothetical protein
MNQRKCSEASMWWKRSRKEVRKEVQQAKDGRKQSGRGIREVEFRGADKQAERH